MFRHPNSKHSNEPTNDFTLQNKIDQSIRYFKVPAMKDKEDVLNTLLDKISTEQTTIYTISNKKTRTLYYSLASVAAVGLVLIMLYFSFAFETFTGVQNQANVFYLPDNSRVILTEGTELKYSKLYFNRKVKLRGQAYFEVVSGEGFEVDAGNGNVYVIGTRFSVNDFEKNFNVKCYEGIVGVDYARQKIKIQKGTKFIANNKSFDVVKNLSEAYPSFAIFNYRCENQELPKIWPEIESFFGVKVVDKVVGDKSFTGAISTGDVREVLDILATSMNLQITYVSNNEVIIESKDI